MNLHTRNFMFLALLQLLVYASCAEQKTGAANEIPALYSRENVQPDWESKDWTDANTIMITGEKTKSENRMKVFSRWNTDSLYFFFRVEDTFLNAYQDEKDHPQLFLDDMVEVLIDTQNEKDSCWAEDDIVYHINLLGVKKDDRGTLECQTNPLWDGEARISVYLFGAINDTTRVDTGYMVTLSIPWIEVEQKPVSGLTMGINFANGDNDGKGRQLFDWVGAWPMRSPYAYGKLILKKNNR